MSHTFTAVTGDSSAAAGIGLLGPCDSVQANMETHLKFLVPLSRDKRGERLAFASSHNLGVEITAFMGGDALNDPAARAALEVEFEHELAGFEGVESYHGAFVDLALHSPDKSVAAISRARMERDVLTALRLGCEKIVFHLGCNPLVPDEAVIHQLVDAHVDFWGYILEAYPGITICLENNWEPDWYLFAKIFARVPHARLGMCLDVAHVHVFSHFETQAWIERMASRIYHLHLTDNFGDRDAHLPLGAGNIDWSAIFKSFQSLKHAKTATLEMNDQAALERSFNRIRSHGVALGTHPRRPLALAPSARPKPQAKIS